jgi:hypothetical protein
MIVEVWMASKVKLPLRDAKDLGTSRGMVTVLWTVREHGPLTFEKLFEMLFSSAANINPTSSDVRNLRTTAVSIADNTRLLAEALERLTEAGVVQIEGGDLSLVKHITSATMGAAIKARNSITISSSATLAAIQGVFDLSLTALANGEGNNLNIAPSFGKPLDGEWCEVFMIMPFAEHLKPIYERHILPAVSSLSLSCKRGDDFFSDNSIIDEVWSAIYFSKLCIVECTGRNANVFYEMGMAHTVGRSCIMIAQNIDDIPFDVQQRRVITYENTPDGLRKFKQVLIKTIQSELGLETDKLQDIFSKLDATNW